MPRTDASSVVEDVVGRFAALVRHVARRYRLDETDVEELLQDVRIRLWRASQRGEQIERLPTSYVYRTTMSAAHRVYPGEPRSCAVAKNALGGVQRLQIRREVTLRLAQIATPKCQQSVLILQLAFPSCQSVSSRDCPYRIELLCRAGPIAFPLGHVGEPQPCVEFLAPLLGASCPGKVLLE